MLLFAKYTKAQQIMKTEEQYKTVAQRLKQADILVVNAGAGMSVDSGMPDFRGKSGLWGNVENNTGKRIFETVNPKNLLQNPEIVWNIFSKRLDLYTNTTPHNGYKLILKWIKVLKLPYFIITSNIDGHFQKAGFNPENVREIHGSIYYLQCTIPCTKDIYPINEHSTNLSQQIKNTDYPVCPKCGQPARPNVYMFRDGTYIPARSKQQEKLFQEFLDTHPTNNMLIFEIGAGRHVQAIRSKTRQLASRFGAHIVRINRDESKIKAPHTGINQTALDALTGIDKYIQE